MKERRSIICMNFGVAIGFSTSIYVPWSLELELTIVPNRCWILITHSEAKKLVHAYPSTSLRFRGTV